MICCYEMRKGRGSCVEPSSLKNFGSMFDAEAIHAQIPSNIEPNYQRTWCNGHKTGHASFLSSYIANLPLVSPMFVLGLLRILMGAAGLRVGWIIAGRDNLWAGEEQRKRSLNFEYGYKEIVPQDRCLQIDFNVGG